MTSSSRNSVYKMMLRCVPPPDSPPSRALTFIENVLKCQWKLVPVREGTELMINGLHEPMGYGKHDSTDLYGSQAGERACLYFLQKLVDSAFLERILQHGLSHGWKLK